jgi:lysine-N-methylase
VPPPEAITAQYLARFRCLGTSCEDTCCQGWQVPLDRRHYQILKTAMDGSRAEREEFRAGVQRDRTPGRPADRYARLRLEPERTCPFLTEQKLCSVQARYGEKALPPVCATYPRVIAQAGARYEVWGVLSCPELARQCLLHEDAMELVDAAPEVSSRGEASRVLPAEPPLPYDRYLDEVRATAFKVLSLREYPVGTRLFLLAYLGKETADFFRKDIAEVDEARLAATLEHVTRPATIAQWHRELAALPPPRALTANLVSQLIQAQGEVQVGSFRRLVAETLASYRPGGGVITDEQGNPTVSASSLWADHARRRQQWQAVLAPRIDQYFENYAKNFWMREWYTTSIDLLAHARRLLVRVAVLRFLLFGHPSLVAARELSDVARQEALDRAAVEVFYKFSRAVEHQGSFLDRIAATVVEHGMQTFAHSTFLTLV